MRPIGLALLVSLSLLASAQQDTDVRALRERALAAGWHKALEGSRFEDPLTGRVIEMVRYDRTGPVFFTTDNRAAARTTGTDLLWVGESSGFALSGGGVSLAMWDAGAVRASHREFGGRVVVREGATLSIHATHVAGTLVAQGLDPAAIGMAPGAALGSYDWNNDVSEMALEASKGLLLSNHSYGIVAGWRSSAGNWYWHGDESVSTDEDYKFGFYDGLAAAWDGLAYEAPFYLVVKSAGNDRGESPGLQPAQHQVWHNGQWSESATIRQKDGGDTGYDTVASYALAKNSLTVGAVADVTTYTGPSSVKVLDFSGRGPTDDGRIKPDVVANGEALWSTESLSDSAYRSMSGTSMAAPNAAGTIALVLQQWLVRHSGRTPRSATLKALAIQTALEVGDAPGPDYSSGWGLLNGPGMAAAVAKDGPLRPTVFEEALDQGQTWAFGFYGDGTEAIRATLVWTDRPGTVTGPRLNAPDRKLVNDLDLRVVSPSGIALPWVLDPKRPADPATKGDNSRDNVEQVVVPAGTPGVFRVLVSHKGELVGGRQAFSLVLEGQPEWRLVTGKLQLTGLAAGASGPSGFEVRFRRPGTLESFAWRYASLATDGSFTVIAPPGRFDLTVQIGSWLRRTVSYDAGSGNVVGLILTLLNGDVTHDNRVDIADFLALRSAYGSSPGASNWDDRADVNRDGAVGIADFLILRQYFGRSGDQ
ncbi:MAG: S8 family serine peptidase [Fimbriimonadaceae bacterium]|nr:S8 family serine peptidase [Fimbriimonadaceae bacterium]